MRQITIICLGGFIGGATGYMLGAKGITGLAIGMCWALAIYILK